MTSGNLGKSFFKVLLSPLADRGEGGALGTPPLGPIFKIFMQFLKKNLAKIRGWRALGNPGSPIGPGRFHICEIRFYRPQTNFAKVMFSQVSVCPQEGVCIPACNGADTPQQVHTPMGRHPSRYTPVGR